MTESPAPSRRNQCVIDAQYPPLGDTFCFCEFEGDLDGGQFTVYTGLSVFSDMPPPGQALLAIWHPDGQEQVDTFCATHREALGRLKDRLAPDRRVVDEEEPPSP